MTHARHFRHIAQTFLATSLVALGLTGAAHAQSLPGQGVTVQPLKSSLAEEAFQTLLVSRALEKLGYEVKPLKDLEPATAHLAIANGDATFMASHWNLLHVDFYKNSGGDARLFRKGLYADQAAQGYLIDKKTADQYKITNLAQLKDPKLAKLFDTNGDGKADLTGCNPGWGCELAIEHHLKAYKLGDTISHKQGSYAALIADTITRFKQGQPILYYTWTPYWVSAVLRPGKDVVWLEVPFSASQDDAKADTRLPNGKNYGFRVNQQQIVANKTFTDEHPAAAKLFEIMQLPIADINAQNLRMSRGEGKAADVDRHTDSWIQAHQKTFDGWIAQAIRAAKTE
ncbi:MAG: glycine betaine/L-proline ABC transporter substrate-binding protein ProX [Pseudomonadota bacterium]